MTYFVLVFCFQESPIRNHGWQNTYPGKVQIPVTADEYMESVYLA